MKNLKKNQKNMLIGGLLALVLVMTVAYAAFASNLSITSTATTTNSWNVLITNIQSKNIVGSATNNSATYTDLTANFSASLVSPGDSITYEITVSNQGSLDAYLNSITPSITNNELINVEYTGITVGEKLYKGENKKLLVVITFDDSIDISSLTDTTITNISLTLNYTQATTNYQNKTITLNYDSRSGSIVDSVQIGLSDTLITLPTTTRNGYIFGGWWTKKNGLGTKINEGDIVARLYDAAYDKTDDSFTIYAYWQPRYYTVYYDTQGGAEVASNTRRTYSSSNLYSNRRPGDYGNYSFVEYNSNPNGTGLSVTDDTTIGQIIAAQGLSDTVEEITIYAIWEQNS